ncbi:MAG: hypothetical protein KFF46_04780 [Desulfobacterales bacterium]|nr:hypothetical protein [Desulfobacterales bacterium]
MSPYPDPTIHEFTDIIDENISFDGHFYRCLGGVAGLDSAKNGRFHMNARCLSGGGRRQGGRGAEASRRCGAKTASIQTTMIMSV